MKIYITLIVLISVLLTQTSYAQKKTYQHNWIYLKGVVSEIVKSPKTKRIPSLKLAREKNVDKKVIEMVARFVRLNKAVYKLKKGNNKQAKKYFTHYRKLERSVDSFAAARDNDEGIGACMSECADYFPGIGFGNGINRAACKIACLVHGG